MHISCGIAPNFGAFDGINGYGGIIQQIKDNLDICISGTTIYRIATIYAFGIFIDFRCIGP